VARDRLKGPRRWPKRILLVVVGLCVLYAVAGNAFLRGRWGRAALNRKPERFSVSWDSAWTSLPGLLHLRGLELAGTSRRVAWRATLDRGTAWVFLPSLARRHFWLLTGREAGAVVEMDVVPKPEGESPGGEGRGWRVTLDGLRLDDLRRFRVGPYEIAGAGSIGGEAHFQVRGPMRLGLRRIRYERGSVLSGGEEVARDIEMDAALSTLPLVVTDPLATMLSRASGRLRLAAEADNLGFLAPYLRKAPWLGLGGSGHLDLDLGLVAGQLLPGGRLDLSGPEVQAEFFDFRARGGGRIEGEVLAGDGGLTLAAELEEFSLERLSDGAVLAGGNGLRARVGTASRAVYEPPEHLRGEIELPPAGPVDLSLLGVYLPPGTGIRLDRGEAELSARLAFDTGTSEGEGWLKLVAHDVVGKFGDADLGLDLVLDARMPRLDLLAGEFDVSGTELAIDSGRVERQGRVRADGWSARIHVPSGSVHLPPREGTAAGKRRGPPRISAQVRAEMRDSAPVLVFMEQRLPALHWLERALTVPDVKLAGRVALEGERMGLRGIDIRGGENDRLELRAELDVDRDQATGAVYARYQALDAALALGLGERKWRLVRARQGYDEAVAAFLATRAAEPP
jgi:hypothetical protein